MAYLLDTNVLSEVRKGPRTHPSVAAWFNSVDQTDLYVSVLVLGEIRAGIERLMPNDPAQALIFEAWLQSLSQDFADRALPITRQVADTWGYLWSLRPLPVADALMAATALAHNLTFVTRNARDVVGTGVDVLDPFEA